MDRESALKGWNIDLKRVYAGVLGDGKEPQPGVGCRLWESPEGDTAALLYDIIEVGVSKEIGRLALFRRKADPELAFDFPFLRCWYLYESGVQFGRNGLLFVHRFTDGARLGVKVCALDPSAGRFALIDSLPEFFYDIRPVEGTRCAFRRMSQDAPAEEVLVDMEKQDWRKLRSWSDFQQDAPMPVRLMSAAVNILRRILL